MSRTGGVKIKIIDDMKLDTNIAHEPNLWMISEENPLPEHVEQNSLGYVALKAINTCILDGGPKARMPVLQDGIKRYLKISPSAPPAAKPSNENLAPSNISRPSDERESSESSVLGSEESANSRHSGLSQPSKETMTVNDVTHAMSGQTGNNHSSSDSSQLTSTALSSQSQSNGLNQVVSNMMTSGMLAQQQGQQPQITIQINALNQQIRLLQQQQQSQQQQEQRQAAWNNVAQNNATMAFLSSHITNSQNAQQQHQETFNNQGPNNNQVAATFLANMFASQQGTTSSPGPSPNNIPQQQASPVARSQPRNDNIVGAQQQQYINEVPSGATTSYFNSILASQQQLQQQGYSNQSSATSTSSMSSGLADLQGGQAGQIEQLVNTLLSGHHMQQQQNNSTNSSNMSPEALRALVGQAILLGARFGADSAMNQNSSSSDSNGNNAGSSDTA